MAETIFEIEGHLFRFLELDKKPVMVLTDKDRQDALEFARAELIANHQKEFAELFGKFLDEIFKNKKELFKYLIKKYKIKI